jgi:16S rRNA C967 or C1407 C5-methylase (RsmB/RsmF family)
MKKKVKGEEAFHQYYSEVWKDRWQSLKDALFANGKKVFRKNKWVESQTHSDEFIPECFLDENNESVNDLMPYYYMDPASVIVARNLNVKPGSKVLDMCAAPGGKSLILFEQMNGEGTLVCNELSRNRKERLRRVVGEYIPKELRDHIDIRGFDGNKYGIHQKDEFDYVLLDAPCSGERHLMETPSELAKWSKKRTQRLSTNQYSLLCSALLACKSGGEITYSTCSLSDLENDQVIKKLLDKKGEQVELITEFENFGFGEKTECGMIFLPDECGFGPLYMARLRKK